MIYNTKLLGEVELDTLKVEYWVYSAQRSQILIGPFRTQRDALNDAQTEWEKLSVRTLTVCGVKALKILEIMAAEDEAKAKQISERYAQIEKDMNA